MDIQSLLQITNDQNASDLHLSTEQPPIIRIDGDLKPLDFPALQSKQLNTMLQSIMSEEQQKQLKDQLEIDFSYTHSDKARFRVNIFHQQRGLSAAFRLIPAKIPTFEELNLPPLFKDLCMLPNGIVLITGPTGSGKSTTLAAMIDELNKHTQKHIITIEDPIEFTHQCNKCLINQRELHSNTKSFDNALRAALREDPDVILVGEMRDPETIRLALTAAETGHLVLATLHTNSAAKTIDRLVDVFGANEKDLVRAMLAESLRAVISQTLVKQINGGRVAAFEILLTTPAIRNLIRENKVAQIYSAIQTGQAKGMCTLEQSLEKLASQGIIAPQQNQEEQLCAA